jgi:hypothetical protein
MAYPLLTVWIDQSPGQIFKDASREEITSYVIDVNAKRGRNRLINDFEAGSATITLADTDGNFSPTNTASPFYPLLPMQKIRIYVQGTVDFDPVVIWTGYINIVNTSFSQGVYSVNRVTLQCTDAFRIINNATISTVTGAGTTELTSVRVNKLLDQIGWPAATGLEPDTREIQTGDVTVQADTGALRQALDAFKTVQDSEQGSFFINRFGSPAFLSRTGTIGRSVNRTNRTFGQDQYINSVVKYDDDILVNNVTVTTAGGTPQVASNAASITAYFQRNASRSVITTTDAEALYIAKSLINVLSDVTPRIDSVTLNLSAFSSPFDWLKIYQLLQTDLMYGIVITKQMQNSQTLTVYDVISGIEWNIKNNEFLVTYYTQESIVNAFVLSDANLGRLDYNGLGQ